GGGEARWRLESNNRIDLITDQDEYRTGDIAEILIPSPYSGTVYSLITIERGHIMDTEVRKLTGTSEVLRIPIQQEHVPNIFVSVILVQGSADAFDQLANFKMGEVLLPVSVEEKTLHITLSPDKKMDKEAYYHPREVAVYEVLVTDNAGNPVEAELSLRLADLSVLALADEVGPTLIERFWNQRGLGVRTSTALAVAMEAYNRELEPRAKGGSGGGGEGEDGLIRSKFADTAFWEPVIRTDSAGKAKVEVPLPDNLTTWRMQARGITVDTQVGRGEVDIISSLDLLVRPVLPRFFVVGDEARIGTIVHNNTDQTLSTVVSLSVEGLEVAGSREQTIDIPARDKVRLSWPVKVLNVTEVVVEMQARAENEGLFDGREDRLPVFRYSTPEIVGTAGRLPEIELRQEVIQLPGAFDPSQGALNIQLDGSLTAATSDALRYLEHYPYECVEQTVSRFLPNVLTYQALQEMEIDQPELSSKITGQVRSAVQRLINEQHYDGGWGWWRSEDSNTYLTSYALQALVEADRAGFPVERNVMHRAADYLRENMIPVNPGLLTWEANRLAYQLYVLGEYINALEEAEPAGELGWAVKLYEEREKLDHYGKALLAVALGLLDTEDTTRTDVVLSDLVDAAQTSATGIHWEESQPDYWNMNTDIRTTAIVLWALARHNPQSGLLPNAVRWLMDVRREGYWESTNTTAWSLMALVTYMRATGELAGEFNYTVSLNGHILLEATVNTATIHESQTLEIDIARLFVDEVNRLFIERHPAGEGQSGEGQLYYTAHLSYYLPAEEVEALDRGLIVARQYTPLNDPLRSVESARVGDVLRVKLTVIAPTDLHYVVVEDPLPAGCEAVDLSLKTTSVVGEQPSVHNLTAEEEDFWYRQYGWGWWWFSHSEMRDEKVALFATYLPRGTYEYTYLIRASVPGQFNVIPASAYEMYFPEVFGRSDGGQFTVIEAE
ncbi:MAG: alpha-2-macroglobulin family protein, partial [Anaerolineae bacterium]|nr:alpha-2-macroglobulin family protein [Anaerolineae bacterium]